MQSESKLTLYTDLACMLLRGRHPRRGKTGILGLSQVLDKLNDADIDESVFVKLSSLFGIAERQLQTHYTTIVKIVPAHLLEFDTLDFRPISFTMIFKSSICSVAKQAIALLEQFDRVVHLAKISRDTGEITWDEFRYYKKVAGKDIRRTYLQAYTLLINASQEEEHLIQSK